MEIFCPECMGTVRTTDGKNARCSVHGGTFQILFNRVAVNLSEQPAPETPPPTAPGEAPAGATEPELVAKSEAPPLPPGMVAVDSPGPQPVAMRCAQHPGNVAIRQCQSCGVHMCATCDFEFPGGIHLCPACATKPQPSLSPKRKRSMIWSYVLAGGATLGMALTFALAGLMQGNRGAENLVGMLMMLFVMGPAIGGLAVGFGAVDKRLKTPAALWGAIVWNALILGGFLLLCVVGTFS